MAESQELSSIPEHLDLSTESEMLEMESLYRITQNADAVLKHVDAELNVRKQKWASELEDSHQAKIGSKTVIMDCSSVVIGHSNIIVQNQDNSSEKRERHVDDMTKKLAGLQIVSTILERGNGTLGFSELEEEVGKELKMLGLEYFSKVSGWTLLDFLTLEKDRYKLHRNKKKRINAVTLREIYRKVPTSKMQSRSLEKPSFSEYESTHKTESANNSASRNTTEYMKSLDDKEEWTVVNTQRSGKRSAKPVSEKRNPDVTNDEADLFDSTFLQLPFEDFDPELFKTLISRGEDERTIYVESLNTYETDPLTFCVDIVSLWNTPVDGLSYIVVGIDTDSKPHGVKRCIDKDFFKRLFHPEYFTTMPSFTTKKILYNSKSYYIVSINDSKGLDSPCVIKLPLETKRIALNKNEIVTRQLKHPVALEASSKEFHTIFQWFSRTIKQEITCHKNENKEEVLVEDKEEENEEELSNFWKEVSGFKKGSFLLLTGDVQDSRHTHALGLLPWIAVYDFDTNSPETGLFNKCEVSLGNRRCLKVLSWNDDINDPLTEYSTRWCFLRGRKEIKESRTDLEKDETEESNAWFKKVKETIKTNAKNLDTFLEYRTLTVIILWPENEKFVQFMNKFLTCLQYELTDSPKVLLVKDRNVPKTDEGLTPLKAMANDFGDNFHSFDIPFGEFCAQIARMMKTYGPENGFTLELPCAPDTRQVNTRVAIQEEKAAWLAENLEVLYLNAPFGSNIPDDKKLSEELTLFRKGGTINWSTMYNVNFEKAVIERDAQSQLKRQVQKRLQEFKLSDVRLFHSPGAGGTTLARDVVWRMHFHYPCAQLKSRMVLNDDDTLEKRVQYIHDQTGLPLLLLVDSDGGPEDFYLKKRLSNTITLYVRRYSHEPGKTCDGLVFLPNKVSESEATQLVQSLSPCCDTEKQRRQLQRYQQKAREGRAHLYDFGLTVYMHEYRGVVSYVRNCLQLNGKSIIELKPDQKCLAFLSLVLYYGHTGIPCQFFAPLIGFPPNTALDLGDFPSNVLEFAVGDKNAYRKDNIRICHSIIAKEILEQTLTSVMKENAEERNEMISDAACEKLFDLCTEFIKYTGKRNSTLSSCVRDILTKTFIVRARSFKTDGERTKKRTKLSRLLEDIPPRPPLFTQRMELLNTLKKTFPKSPSFHAHLGRFYAYSRLDGEQQAEKLFREAVRLCEEQKQTCISTTPLDRDRAFLEAAHVYHMFGVMKKSSASKKTFSVNLAKLNKVIRCANEASDYFHKSRINTPPTHEIYIYAFTEDIEIRLQVCEAIRNVMGENWASKVRKNLILKCLLETNMVTIRRLVHECFLNQWMKEEDVKSLMMMIGRYNAIFCHFIDAMDFSGRVSPATMSLCDRRLKIAAMTVKNGKRDIFDYLDAETDSSKIDELVDMYEHNFSEMFRPGLKEEEKMELENEMIAWLQTIRHTKFTRHYSIEEVLLQVQKWEKYLKTATALYYTFICNALLGLGYDGISPNKEFLEIADEVCCNLRKKHATVIKSSIPREWLGKINQGFKRLVSADPRMGLPADTVFQMSTDLALCVGVIAKPKTASETTTNAVIIYPVRTKRGQYDIHVRFEPKAAKLQVSTCCERKVEFNLAFTIKNGYEAFNVKLLKRYACLGCGTWISFTSEERCRPCYNCNIDVFKFDLNKQR
ncbi:uncharacterized protein LOC128217686 [Mya arenaria]|uniref:uncharacterized protein LOC128217686 n=1 Tax=Mya arenaria TaxID=6604 RepID=UPI0022E08F24|nr:uncharacterized protein LOC128217686 [Mya arenaria]XP_052780959.1 uncharacterized protein LOC128217686 [Mya arenaria]